MSEKRTLIFRYVKKQIEILNSQKDTGAGKAKLAELRRGIGKYPGEIPELWGAFLDGIPEELLSENGIPSYAEWAIYLSLTLFALNQQGNTGNVCTDDSKSLGKAVSELMENNSEEERARVLRRFSPVLTASDMTEFSHHIRGLVQLMKSKNIKLNYAKLSEDIYDFQFEDGRKRVQLKWAQDFYRKRNEITEGEEK